MRCSGGADMAVASRSPRLDSWLNRLQSRGVPQDSRRRVRPAVPRHGLRGPGDASRGGGRRCRSTVTCIDSSPPWRCAKGYQVRRGPGAAAPQRCPDAVYGPGVYFRRLLDIAAFFFLAKFTEKPLRFFGLVGSVFLAFGAVTRLVLLVETGRGTGYRQPAGCSCSAVLLRGPGSAAHRAGPGGRDHRPPAGAPSASLPGARADLSVVSLQ